MSSGIGEDALVLRATARGSSPRLGRSTAVAASAMALGGVVWSVASVVAGQVVVGLVVFAWSAYAGYGWTKGLRPPRGRPEMLRMDTAGVTVRHPGSDAAEAWSVNWEDVRSLTVREIPMPEKLHEHLGKATKVLSVEVADHRRVEGPDDYRQRLYPWALLTGDTPARTRLQLLLASVHPDAVSRIAGWLGEHRPALPLDFEMGGTAETSRERVQCVAVRVQDQALRTQLVGRLQDLGLRTQELTEGADDAVADVLRTCTAAVAADTDPDLLSEAVGRAGVDRVLWVPTEITDPSLLVRPERAWSVLDLSPRDGTANLPAEAEIAEVMVKLLVDRNAIGRQWRLGADGEPVAVSLPA